MSQDSIKDNGQTTQSDFLSVKQFPQSSKMNQTQTLGMSNGEKTMSNTSKSRFKGQVMGEQMIKVRKSQVDLMRTIGNETLTTIGDPQ